MSDNNPATPDIPRDPILERSLSVPIVLAALAVLAAVVLVIVDEFVWRRPYMGIQRTWREAMVGYLDGVQGERAAVQKAMEGLDDFATLTQAVADATAATAAERDALQAEIAAISAELTALREAVKSPRSEIAALSYSAEHAADAAGKKPVSEAEGAQHYLEKVETVKNREITYSWMVGDEQKSSTSTVRELLGRADALQVQKSGKQGDLGVATQAKAAAEAKLNRWIDENMGNVALIVENADDGTKEQIANRVIEVGAEKYLERHVTALKPGQVAGLRNAIADWWVGDIKQLHIQDTNNWVDRCETCHLNARSPLPINAEDLGGDEMRVYESHPRMAELFGTHDPERFGCSMCHGGNGVAITAGKPGISAETYAHGLNHYWLHRLHPKTNYEAGCNQCHVRDIHLEGGERISQAKENYRKYGCWGCHELEGYDVEPVRMRVVGKRISDIDDEMRALELKARNLQAALDPLFELDDQSKTPAVKADVQREQSALRMQISGLQTERDNLVLTFSDLVKERKKVGPNLKDLRAKVRPQWLTQWVADGIAWRPTTKMPMFRWYGDDEAKDVAAFLWQSATDVTTDRKAFGIEELRPGDPTAGEDLFRTVGCMSCHATGSAADGTLVGSDFAANLSNLGDKSNLEYVVRWIENPRHRLAPFCAECKRDLTPADFEKQGEGLVFGREHATCPNCGHELQWNNPVVMPSFRLTRQQSTDIATYLLSQRGGSGVEFPTEAPWLEETARFERGKRLVQHHGCAGCHEIAGFEDEGRIGTPLNGWGSKPLERLDFGHYTIDAKRGHEPMTGWTAPKDGRQIFDEERDFYEHGSWYNHRGFAMHKLAKPEIYDASKNVEGDRWTRLRMPKFNLSGQEIYDVVSLLTGSFEDTVLPETIKHNPDETGQDVREGWWLVRKYNCEGCHQIRPGEVPAIQNVPHFMDEQENAGDRPPYLVGTGFRTQPSWLRNFLKDPSLGGGTKQPKSVREHLSVRMPTFELTDREARTLVRFFNALASQPSLYEPEPVQPLSTQEQAAAVTIFKEANCVQCHVVTGLPITDETKAPNLSWAGKRLRPEWMRRWLQNPQLMEPGTAMLAFFKHVCPSCGVAHAPDDLKKNPNQCPNCESSLVGGRWVYQNDKLDAVNAVKGDHIELMVRYLRTLGD